MAGASRQGGIVGRIALAVLATVVTLEVGACALLGLGGGLGVAPEELAASLPQTEPGETLRARGWRNPEALRPYVLHPYIGFVRNRQLDRHFLNDIPVEVPVNDHGFFGPAATERRADEFVVAVAGGSVAAELYVHAADELAARLAELAPAQGKRVRLVSIALGGFKQPQALAAVSYFLAIGLHFDAVVVLDGFNEVVLPWAENRPQQSSPYYPRMWRVYATRTIDAKSAVLYGRIFDLKRRIESSRDFYARAPYRYSQLFRLIWVRSYARMTARKQRFEADLRANLARDELTPQEEGPPYPYGDGMFEDFARLWRTTSIQLWQLCRANGIDYFHFLQPNQYVAGSKPFTPEEQRLAMDEPGTHYREGVALGYPHLFEEAHDLEAAGVPFVDLTGLYREESRTVYRDRCCHLSELGNSILVNAIADVLAAHYDDPAGEAQGS